MSAPLTVADVLDAAADLIEPEGAWVQGAFARDANGGNLASARNSDACCWCMYGAVIVAGDGKHINAINDILEASVGGPLSFNDEPGRTQAEVVAALRAAAAAAREGAAS